MSNQGVPQQQQAILVTPGDYRDRFERLTGHSLRECPICLTFYFFTLAYFASQVDRRPAFLAVRALPSCPIVLQFLLWQYYRRQADSLRSV